VSEVNQNPNGHLFVIDGDLQGVAVDAWFLPLDASFSPTPLWRKTLSAVDFRPSDQVDWEPGELARFLDYVDGADVWIGNVGRSEWLAENSPEHYASCAIQFIEKAAARWKIANPNKTRLPLVAINHIGTGNGGARTTHGEVLKTVVNAISQRLNDGTLKSDVLLVSWGPKPSSAAQHMRHERFKNWRDDPQWSFPHLEIQVHDTALRLAEHMKNGSSCVFLGAGVSVGAGLKGWDALLEDVGKITDPPTTAQELSQFQDPRDKAALLEMRLVKSGTSIGSTLGSYLSASKYSLQHGLLASLPSNEFITTNIDELFEKACRINNREVSVIPQKPVGRGRWLLKLHGTISLPESVVFTRDHYLSAIRSSRALLGLVQAMLFTRHMLFVGYGLRDEDFHELVYEVRSAFPDGKTEEKLGTAIALFDDPLQKELWDDMLNVLPMRPALNGRAPSHEEIQQAGRDVERFLDLVCMLSSTRSSFLLDEQYVGARTVEENQSWKTMKDLVSLAQKHNDSETGWSEVRELLRRLGAEFNG
jgi:hypothetical protein